MSTPTRLFDILNQQALSNPIDRALNTKHNGIWEHTSTKEYLGKANQISRGLLELGVGKGDKIALISSNNRTEWCVVDIGVLQIGAIDVPIYPTITAEDYAYILSMFVYKENHSKVPLDD